MRTPSGAIDESVDGVLMAWSASEARLWLRFHTAGVAPARGAGSISYVSVPPVQRLAGDLSVTAMNHTGRHRLVFIELWLTLSELGVNGYLDGWIFGLDDEYLRAAPLLATIGETCDGGYGIPLGPEDQPVPDQLTPSAREVLALLGEMRIDAVRDDGARLPLSLDLDYTPDSACGRPNDRTPLTFEAVLAIAADLGDATIDGRWPLEIRVRSATRGAPASVHVTLGQRGDVSIERSEIESLEDDWGVADLDVDGYDQVLITFDLTLEPGTDPPGVAGELLIRGYVLPEDRSRPVSTAAATCWAASVSKQRTEDEQSHDAFTQRGGHLDPCERRRSVSREPGGHLPRARDRRRSRPHRTVRCSRPEGSPSVDQRAVRTELSSPRWSVGATGSRRPAMQVVQGCAR